MTPLAAVATYHERETPYQGRIPHGPVAIVARGRRAEIPENGEFWNAVNAVTFEARGAGRRAVYRAVAYYASLTTARQCFASVATIAKRAGLCERATRSQLRALERDGHLQAVGGRSGGRHGTRYTLTSEACNPAVSVSQPGSKCRVNPAVSAPEVGKERKGAFKATAFFSPEVSTQPTAAPRPAALEAPPAALTGKHPGPERLVMVEGRTSASDKPPRSAHEMRMATLLAAPGNHVSGAGKVVDWSLFDLPSVEAEAATCLAREAEKQRPTVNRCGHCRAKYTGHRDICPHCAYDPVGVYAGESRPSADFNAGGDP